MRRRTLLGAAALAGLSGWWWLHRWDAIIVHHSAGSTGDLDLLCRVHARRQARDPLDMIPYHFVIGNGRGMGMGETVPTRRWRHTLWGAHVRGWRRNLGSIGICLIGNFDTGPVPEPQYRALVELVRALRVRHGIDAARVTLHGQTEGQNTRCPGQHFPGLRLRRDIA